MRILTHHPLPILCTNRLVELNLAYNRNRDSYQAGSAKNRLRQKWSWFRKLETGHSGSVLDAQINARFRLLVTFSENNTIKIFDLLDRKQTLITDLCEYNWPISWIAWSRPHWELILVASIDRNIVIWSGGRNLWKILTRFLLENTVDGHWPCWEKTTMSRSGMSLLQEFGFASTTVSRDEIAPERCKNNDKISANLKCTLLKLF